MCGIVGATAKRDIVPILVDGLRRLEYRGYDSAGVAVINAGHLKRVRAAGRVAELATQASAQHVSGPTGIAHTRWATHGAPTAANAHPHATDHLAACHVPVEDAERATAGRAAATGGGR